MQNGMGNDNLTYKIIEGIPSANIFDCLIELYVELFEDADLPFFKKRFEEKRGLISILAYSLHTLVGFKIGFMYKDTTFYSWIGGVKKTHRLNGIARHLALLQEQTVKQKGYTKIRTKSMNRFKPMMAINLKNGFDIIQVYTNSKGQKKIIFEKSIG